MGNIVETTGTYLTSGKGTNIFGRGPNSERRQDIKAEEEKMVDEINKLKIDPSTGLPVLASLEDDKEMALSDKEDAISGLSKKATTQQDRMFADLYKQGVTTHGKFTGLQKDLSEGFSTDVSKVMSDFSEDTGSIEDKALSDLATIRQSIVDTENLYKTTDTLENAFPSKRYETTLTMGEKKTNPLDVKDKMYEYDYVTGLKDILNEKA